ncbi:esterase/lipase family protein [Comamonas endophytica]|uniref:Triacylglycerol lipase n=1 Tax=Comamonas endophytica TaxID=2949090 RepID=A0ABY6GFT0_9BURK|nr:MULTISPECIES: triacylglycerol lipase [unclassified Acidovorax]MCD2513285.1 triacylglycerol lipase [Acidovorax sp. D4N7]UYG53372.1 triacylglycerol lipase [Acidovorax sp. 5MLIR]
MTGCLHRVLRRLLFMAAAGLLLAGMAQAQGGDGYTQTRYPIMLVHGLFGFDTTLGMEYFYGIPGALRQGGARVYVARVSGAHSTEVRGEQLLAQVRNVLALSGAAKVHLIGHSHGGLTARYVAGVAPQLVASVTAIAAPNRGSRLADIVRNATPPGSVSESVAKGAARALVGLIGLFSGGERLPQMPAAALNSFTTAGIADFNRRFPQGVPSGCGHGEELVDGVRYYSWTGTRLLTNPLDPSDLPLSLLGLVFDEPNDGLVTACSARLGTHLGDYPHNHLDQINQMLGLRGWFSVDPVALYRQHANRLKLLGL